MSERVVLAPDDGPTDGSQLYIRRSGGAIILGSEDGLRIAILSGAGELPIVSTEALHLRDLLCEWYGIPGAGDE